MTSRTLHEYNADTRIGKWFSPSSGALLLELDGISFDEHYRIAAAISGADRIARGAACRNLRNHLENTMESYCEDER